jgi:hypothetical protein
MNPICDERQEVDYEFENASMGAVLPCPQRGFG